MSLQNQGKPARIKSVWGHNTGTAAETVYTCPKNCLAEITFIHVVNGGNSTNTVEVEWYVKADNYTSHFLKGKSINAGDYVTFNGIDLVLQAGDELRVIPSSAGHVDTIVTITETLVPVG
jgi:molybdopterin converting factor small subunit